MDIHSYREPLGVTAGITPFNFPAMIPLWVGGDNLPCFALNSNRATMFFVFTRVVGVHKDSTSLCTSNPDYCSVLYLSPALVLSV